MSSPFAAIPPREQWWPLLVLSGTFAVWFALCYGGGAFASAMVPWRVWVEVPLDAQLPYHPGAALLYLTIGPMLLLAPFVLREMASLLPLFATLMLETAIGGLFFVLLPIDDAPVTCGADTFSCAVFRAADAINLHHNNLPSLHVAFAATLALALSPRTSAAGALLLYGWAIAVSVSTLFTRQHFIVDVIAGLLLAVFCWRAAGNWARQPAVVAAFESRLARG
jgi:membrane-associated phospholipid phosphatase